MKQIRFLLVALAVAGTFLLLIPRNASAMEMVTSRLGLTTQFHGYLESRFVARDENGFQYGFMDDMDGVQWMQEMQFDFTVKAHYPYGRPQFGMDKAFFRYRGGYDAIYDVMNRYNDIRPTAGPSRFDLGKNDVKWENDLREAFVDLYGGNSSGSVTGNLRLGRQIVQWGQADIFNLMNIVNPSDYRSRMFFSNPDELATPLYMSRLDLQFPGVGFVSNFNVQYLAIPDIRPDQFAPLDGKYNAPYAFGFKAFAPYPVLEDVPSDNLNHMEQGVRLGLTTQGGMLFDLYYFSGYQYSPAIDFSTLATKGAYTFDHPKQNTFGYSFSKYIETGDFVFRGEGSMTENYTTMDFSDPTGKGYTYHDYYQTLFGFDKTIPHSMLNIGTQSALTTSWQVYFAHIAGYNVDPALGRTAPKNIGRFTMLLSTDYDDGRITPSIAVGYDTYHAWLTNIGVGYSPDFHWYCNLSEISFWGNKSGLSPYAPYVGTASEVEFKVGYQW